MFEVQEVAGLHTAEKRMQKEFLGLSSSNSRSLQDFLVQESTHRSTDYLSTLLHDFSSSMVVGQKHDSSVLIDTLSSPSYLVEETDWLSNFFPTNEESTSRIIEPCPFSWPQEQESCEHTPGMHPPSFPPSSKSPDKKHFQSPAHSHHDDQEQDQVPPLSSKNENVCPAWATAPISSSNSPDLDVFVTNKKNLVRLKKQHAGAVKTKDRFTKQYLLRLPENFTPHKYSVLFGRSKACRKYCGNRRLEIVISWYKDRYNKAHQNQTEKTNIVNEIIDIVQKGCQSQHEYAAAFVRFENDGSWWKVEIAHVREKISSMLRNSLHEKYSSSSASKVEKRRQKRLLLKRSKADFGCENQIMKIMLASRIEHKENGRCTPVSAANNILERSVNPLASMPPTSSMSWM